MNIAIKLTEQNIDPNSLYGKINRAFEFDLNQIAIILDELEKDDVKGFVGVLDFRKASFLIMPSYLTVKPQKIKKMIVGNRIIEETIHLRTEYLKSEHVKNRALLWLDKFSDMPAKSYFVPCIIANTELGWLWCTNTNLSVPLEIIEMIENY